MVRASPQLSRVLEVIDSRRTIAYRKEASFYRVLSADAFRAEGLNIHGLLFDELHAQRDRRLWDALRYGGAAREQPLIVSITTAGYDRNSICWEQYSYAQAVMRDWTHDPTFFPCIYEADEADEWTAEDTWPKANPSWGVTIKPEDFAADCREAQLSSTAHPAPLPRSTAASAGAASTLLPPTTRRHSSRCFPHPTAPTTCCAVSGFPVTTLTSGRSGTGFPTPHGPRNRKAG
jgi:hypothetical protein